MKHVFMKIFSKIFDNNKRGYVAVLLAVFVPLALSLFYLYVTYSQVDSVHTQANIATRDAALEAANHYALYLDPGDDEHNVEIQKNYLKRRAALTFNATLKSKFGIKGNAIPMERKTANYKLALDKNWIYYNDFSYVYGRYSKFFIHEYDANHYDPDYPEHLNGLPGKGIYKKVESSSGELSFDYYVPKSSTSNYIDIRYGGESQNGVPRLKVTSHITTNLKNDTYQKKNNRYSSTFYAEPAECNADIVLAIPMNKAAFTLLNEENDNVIYGNSQYYEQTPIIEMQSALKKFTERFMFYKGLKMGVIPYSGRLSVLPNLDNFDNNFYSRYFQSWGTFEQPEGTLPTIPISDSYKTCGNNGGMLTSGNDSYFGQWGNFIVGSGIISKPTLLSEFFTGINAFRKHPTKFCYGGNISTYAMRCKVGSYFYPSPYPMIPLQENLFSVYSYLSSLGSFELKYKDDSLQRTEIDNNLSNFLFLPFLWGNYLLNYDWAGGSTPSSSRKKVLIILANQPDLFAPHELTYLGFDNDACHVPMIDGERLDFANRVNYVTSYGYNSQCSSIHSTYNENAKLKFSTYDGNYVESETTYTLTMPENQNVRIAVKARTTLTVHNDGSHGICEPRSCVLKDYLGEEKTSVSYGNEIDVSDDDTLEIEVCSASKTGGYITSPVLAKFETKGIQLSVLDSSYSLRADKNDDHEYVYLCKNKMTYSSYYSKVKIKINLVQSASYSQLSYCVNTINSNAYLLSSTSYSSVASPNLSSVSCFKKYNAAVKYEYYGEEKSTDWFRNNDKDNNHTHNCIDVGKSRSTGKGSIDLGGTYTFYKIQFDVYGKRKNIVFANYPSSSWLNLWVCNNSGGNTDCGGSYVCTGTKLGRVSGIPTTKEKEWECVKSNKVFNIGYNVSGRYIVFEGDQEHGYTTLDWVKLYYLGESSFHECRTSGCSEQHNPSSKVKTISARANSYSTKRFYFESKVTLSSNGNIINDKSSGYTERVKSVMLKGCETFYVDKSWIKNKQISIAIKNAKILSIDVSNNIKCEKKDTVSHFKCLENNLEKIALTMDFSRYGNGYDTTKPPFNIDDFIKYENFKLEYSGSNTTNSVDGYWRYGSKRESGSQGTLTIDNDACDYKNGYITVAVSPTDKSLTYGNHKRTFNNTILSNIDIDINELTGRDSKTYFGSYNAEKINCTGCAVSYYYIQNYQYDYPAEDIYLPWWHYDPLFHSHYEARDYKWSSDYPHKLYDVLATTTGNTFTYYYEFKKSWLGSCIIDMHIKMYQIGTTTRRVNLYGKTGVCRNSLSGTATCGCLCYPGCSYTKYTGSNKQDPRIRFYIKGAYTNTSNYPHGREGKLIIKQDPFGTVEGRGRFGVNVEIISSELQVKGGIRSETKGNITGFSSYSFSIKDFNTNKINVNLQALNLHFIKYEGENPICYDRPIAPSKNARWIDFSKANTVAGKVVPSIDKSLQDTFSGTLLEKYEQALQIAQANFDMAESNLKSLGVTYCDGSDLKEPTNAITEDGNNCFDCNNNGFRDPCTMVSPQEADASVVCITKSHKEWLNAKIAYKNAYLKYLKENAKITGHNVEENSSWNPETDAVTEETIAIVAETEKTKRYEDYLSLVEYFDERMKINCKADITGSSSNSEQIKNDNIPSLCMDRKMETEFDYLENDVCKEKLSENLSNLKLQHYKDVGLDTNDFDNKERALIAAENNLRYHLESGNGAYLEYYTTQHPELPAYAGSPVTAPDIYGKKENDAVTNSDLKVEYWNAYIYWIQDLVVGNVKGRLSCRIYPYNSSENRSKTKDRNFLTKVLDPGLVISDNKPDTSYYYDSDSKKYYYYRNYNSMNDYNAKYCGNMNTDIRDYYVGSVICANSNKAISYVRGYTYSGGAIKRYNDYKLVNSYYQEDPFKPNGYLNPCLPLMVGKNGAKSSDGSSENDHICPGLCTGDTLKLYNAVINAETDLDDAEEALNKEYQKIETEIEKAKDAKDEAYQKFLEKGVTLSVDTYTEQGDIEKYRESCEDGEEDPATRVRQANGEACPDKCRERKLKYDSYKKAYDEAKTVLEIAKVDYRNYKDKVGELKSDELIYEDNYLRTHVNKTDTDKNAILLFLTKLHTGDISLIAENFYNKDQNKISYQYLSDVDSAVKENGKISQLPNPIGLKYLTGVGSSFVPYDTRESLSVVELLRNNTDHDMIVGALMQTYDNTRLIFSEFTNPINTILSNNSFNGVSQKVCNNGIYNQTINYSPTQMIKDYVLPAVIAKIKTKFGNYGRIYFINYKNDNNEGPNYVENYSDNGKLKYYAINSVEDLDKTFLEISKDIEDFTKAKSAKAYVEEAY